MASKSKEPSVISLHLLTSSLEASQAEDAKVRNPGSTAPLPAIALGGAETLCLSFRGLVRIQNLESLRSLRKLQLDNNGLTRVEGLECVSATLEWLDLSFNALTSAEGLGSLPRLTDLSLFHNSIPAIGGLEGCTALQCLSMGENALEDLMGSVLYVRKRLPALQVLTLEGNPLCKPGEGGREVYRPFFLAFCPALRYLDYQLVTAAERSAAREGGVPAEKLAEVEDSDAAAAKVLAKEREKAAQLADYVAANLEVIETMYSDLFGGEASSIPMAVDGDWGRLRHIPNMPHVLLALREALEPLAATLRASGMERNSRIREEIEQFQEALAELVGGAGAGAAERVAGWEAALKAARNDHKAAVAAALSMGSSRQGSRGEGGAGSAGGSSSSSSSVDRAALSPRTADKLMELQGAAAAMTTELLKGELAVHEAVETMLDMFDSSLGDLKASKLALQEAFFRGTERAEAKFTELCAKEGESISAMAAAKRLPPELDEEMRALAEDKEALMGALSGAHESRVARILRREGELKAREEKRCSGAVSGARAAEMERNRGRVKELMALGAACEGKVARALLGESGIELSEGSGGVRK